MAKVEIEEETGGSSQSTPQVELVIGIPGLVDVERVRAAAAQWNGSGRRMAVVHPCAPGMGQGLEQQGEVRLVALEVTALANAFAPWPGARA